MYMPDGYVDISCITIPQPAMYVILSVQLDKNINRDSERNIYLLSLVLP